MGLPLWKFYKSSHATSLNSADDIALCSFSRYSCFACACPMWWRRPLVMSVVCFSSHRYTVACSKGSMGCFFLCR